MDQIQRELIKLGRKDLAQEYFEKIAAKKWKVKSLKSNPKITNIIEKIVNEHSDGGNVKFTDYGFGKILFEIKYNSYKSPGEFSTPNDYNEFRKSIENGNFKKLQNELKKVTKITRTHFDNLIGMIKIEDGR